MLVIRDPELIRKLDEMAQQQNISLEDLLSQVFNQIRAQQLAQAPHNESAVAEVRRKAYAEARRYWQSTGDSERLALTDAELDAQFWLFDGEGVPRLKSEEGDVTLPSGSLRALAAEAARARIQFDLADSSIDEADIEAVLNTEFADYLSQAG